MSDFQGLKVAELRARCEAASLPCSGSKKDLIARLQAGGGQSASSAAPTTMKVGELKDALTALGEDTSGKKKDLITRLESAQAASSAKRSAADTAALPLAKKQRVTAGPAWFWAADEGNARIWKVYDAASCTEIEAAFNSGTKQVDVAGGTYYIDLNPMRRPGFAKSFTQLRKDNPTRTRPVVRTDDGTPPKDGPPQPPAQAAAGPSKSSAASSKMPSPTLPASVASAAASSSIAMKSMKPGGVQQARSRTHNRTHSLRHRMHNLFLPHPPPQIRFDAKSGKNGGEKKQIVKGHAAVDASCPIADTFHVLEEGNDIYDVYLNQTDIGQNKNKYYIIQLLESDDGTKQYHCWNRWGRVGEERNAQNALRGPMGLAQAKADFNGKFRDKTSKFGLNTNV
jgi:predicted DNA-binding WGR domain protein